MHERENREKKGSLWWYALSPAVSSPRKKKKFRVLRTTNEWKEQHAGRERESERAQQLFPWESWLIFLLFSLSLLLGPSLSFCKKVRGLILHKECRRPRNTLKLVSKFRSELCWQNSTLMMVLAFSRFPCPIKSPMRYLFQTASREFLEIEGKKRLSFSSKLIQQYWPSKNVVRCTFPSDFFSKERKIASPILIIILLQALAAKVHFSPSFDTWRIYWPKKSFEPSILAAGDRRQEPNWWS